MTIDTAASMWGEFSAMHAWAIATAAVVAAGCALVGTLLVVRRMSLLGDAISHAVLPGIAVAVLAGGRPGGLLVLVGAVAAAVVTVLLVQVLRREGGLAADAGTGVVFTTLFALGVVIITAAASRIDLDPGCILYGILELVPFDTVRVAGVEMPRAFLTGAGVLAVVAVGLAVTWKEQLFIAFDSDAARAVGLPVAAVTGGLLAATALVTVASFEAVGAILVVAMLVVPAATAELLVRRLHVMALVAMLLGVVAAVLGYLAAWRFDTSAAGMIAVVLGLEYVVAAIVAPEDGVVARVAARLALAWRVTCEDTLALLWRADEAAAGVAPQPFRSPGEWAAGLWLAASGRIVREAGRWGLTAIGRAEAETVVRSHRLWEAWLGRHADLPLDHLHPPAEWIEHHLGADLRRRIEADVGAEESDPHGRSIPREP
jgi:manganese/zinc/iron transport system permease protein